VDGKGAGDAVALERLHELIRELHQEGLPLNFLTRHADGQVQIVVMNSSANNNDDDITLLGYEHAIDYLTGLLNAQRWTGDQQ
jgi:hypothetical protein